MGDIFQFCTDIFEVWILWFFRSIFVVGNVEQKTMVVAGNTVSPGANKGVISYPTNFLVFRTNTIFLREAFELISSELVNFLGYTVEIVGMNDICKRNFSRFEIFVGVSINADVVRNELDRPSFVIFPDEQCYCITCSGCDFEVFRRVGRSLKILYRVLVLLLTLLQSFRCFDPVGNIPDEGREYRFTILLRMAVNYFDREYIAVFFTVIANRLEFCIFGLLN